jgi:hypothetical protein
MTLPPPPPPPRLVMKFLDALSFGLAPERFPKGSDLPHYGLA